MNAALRCALSALMLVACRGLPAIPSGVCGNRVIEAPETCDGFNVGSASCRPPGSAHACQLDCSVQSDGTRSVCPAGWGCTPDSVCRKATGAYHVQADRIGGNAFALTSADFNGDGRGEILSRQPASLLGASTFRVHYFDRDAAPVGTWALPITALSYVVSDISGDGRADVALTDGRMGVLLGQADRSLISETYATYFLPKTQARLLSALYDGEVDRTAPLLVLAERDGRLTLMRPDAFSASLTALAEFPGRIADLAGEPVLGHVIEDVSSFPCADLALALRGQNSVSVYTYCKRDPDSQVVTWLEPPIVTNIALDPVAEVEHGPLIADVDGDHHLDLLIGTADGMYVARGDGRRFGIAKPWRADIEAEPNARIMLPLAAGDFSGDVAADFVYSDGFLLSHRSAASDEISYRTMNRRLGSAWTEARIVDLNGNGFADVVAASDHGLDIDFFNGTGTERLNRSIVPTDRPVEHMTVGDFDRDLISDLAFTQLGPANDGQELAIAFGNSAGPPTVALTTTRVGTIAQVGALPFAGADVLGELFLVFEQRDAAGDSGTGVAWLYGTGTRSMLCLVELTTFATDGSIQSVPGLTIATGRFARSDRLDAVLFGSDLEGTMPGMWLVPDLRRRTGLPRSMAFGFDARLAALRDGTSEHPDLALLTAAADSDGDGLDNLVVAAPNIDNEHCLVATAKLVERDETTELQANPALELDQACSRAGQLEVADLDADAASDIVLLTGTPEGPSQLIVLWNDGSGQFASDRMSSLSPVEDAPVAFALVKDTAAKSPSVVYVTQTRAQLLRPAKQRAFDATSLDLSLDRGTGVTATDLDGDGISDIVIADSGSLRILRAELSP